MDRRDLDRHLAQVRESHRRLLDSLAPLTDEHVERPSRLPGWTVGHVLTHVARNADSHVRLIDAACAGQIADQYPPGAAGDPVAARASEIEAGARRPAAELVTDVTRSIEHLELAWAACTDLGWAGHGRTQAGVLVPISDLPFRRWREVEVHRVDLGDDVPGASTPAAWPDAYVREELVRLQMLWRARVPMGLTSLPEAVRVLDDAQRVAWLLGRLELAGVPPAGLMG